MGHENNERLDETPSIKNALEVVAISGSTFQQTLAQRGLHMSSHQQLTPIDEPHATPADLSILRVRVVSRTRCRGCALMYC